MLALERLADLTTVSNQVAQQNPHDIEILLTQASVFLVQDVKDVNSQVLKLQLDSQVNYYEKKEKASVLVKRLQVFRCRFNQDTEFWSILEPVDISLELTTGNNVNIISKIPQIRILISYQDLKFVMYILTQILQSDVIKGLSENKYTLKSGSKKMPLQTTKALKRISVKPPQEKVKDFSKTKHINCFSLT